MTAVTYDPKFDRKVQESVDFIINDLKLDDTPENRAHYSQVARLTLLTSMKVDAE